MQNFSLRVLITFSAAIVAASLSSPAKASFGDCNSPAYVALFDARMASSGFLCTESDRVAVTSDAGTTHIRIVQHIVADWATRPGAMRAFKDGVAASVRAMASLGHFRISDVTILLVDGFAPGGGSEDFGDIAAWTNPDTSPECRITVWLLGAGATVRNGPSVIGHELFHCIQGSSLTAAQIATGGGGVAGSGNWWIEGSADWFATLAVPAAPYMHDRVAAFDGHSATMPLHQMSYDAFVFFAWLGGAPNQVMPFLHSMAGSASASAQQTAMTSALPEARWIKFAEDYLDRRIRDGHGASINSTPSSGETWTWSATRTQRQRLSPFVVARASLVFQCGSWGLRPAPARFHAVAKDGETAWAPLPGTIDALDGTPRRFRFAGLATGTSPTPLQIEATLRSGCEPCLGSNDVDRCLIGTWRMTADGALQWMRENIHNARVTSLSQVGNTLTLNADRTFVTGASTVTGEVQGRGGIASSGNLNTQASGRWSVSPGRLNLCPAASAMSGTIRVTKDGYTSTMPYPARAMHGTSRSYSCSASRFTVTTPMPRGTSVQSVYEKISAPPP